MSNSVKKQNRTDKYYCKQIEVQLFQGSVVVYSEKFMKNKQKYNKNVQCHES